MIVDVIFGFLGSGKTTFIRRILQEWDSHEKIVVLVNEFGEVGIDGELLSSQGGNVVEMPSGCICCTLQADFRAQILEISRAIQPDRIIIEPTGVATIGQIQSILDAQLFEGEIAEIHKILIVDAAGFMGLYRANRHFVESQVENAHLAMLNKCDRVDPRQAMVIQSAISAINPELTVFKTEFGAIDWNAYQAVLSMNSGFHNNHDIPVLGISRHEDGDQLMSSSRKGAVSSGAITTIFDHPPSAELQTGRCTDKAALGYESFGLEFLHGKFDPSCLNGLFTMMGDASSAYGQIVRAKGIFQTATGWILLELASGEVSYQAVRPFKQSRVSIIGNNLNRGNIGMAFEHCQTIGQG